MTLRWFTYLAVLVAGVSLGLSVYFGLYGIRTSPLNNYYSLGYAMLLFVGAVVGIVYRKNRALLMLGLAQFVYGMGEILWSYGVAKGVEVPYPSIADIFYMIYPLFALLGCGMLIVDLGGKVKLGQVIEAVVVVLGWYGVVFWMFLQPGMNLDQPALAVFLNFYYPLGDALCFAMSLLLYRVVGGKKMYVTLVMVGMMLIAVGDLLFSYRESVGLYWNGGVADVTYMGGVVAMVLGMLKAAEGEKVGIKRSR